MSTRSARRSVARKVVVAAALTPPAIVLVATAGTAADTPQTVTGPSVHHTYGDVQVTVTISGGKITDVQATGPTDNPMSASINNGAIPKLNAEAMASQSADIASVSGATLTSPAYKQSLQAALDQAGYVKGGSNAAGGATTTTAPKAVGGSSAVKATPNFTG